jgi:hypothetical protein
MAKIDDYRRAIENATIHAELAPSDEIAKLWQHVRDNYEYLLMLDERTQRPDPAGVWPSRSG